MASGIGSLESIPGLLKCLQIQAQATLASGIGSLELIPGLLKRLQIRAQATLASRIGSLESIPRLHNMKKKDDDDFFKNQNEYIPPSIIKGRKNNEVCLFHKFERSSGANSAYSRNRLDQSDKNELDRSKRNRGGIFKTFMEPRNQFQGIESASLCPGGPVQ